MSEDGISEEVEEEEREPNIAAFAAPAAEHRTASEALAAGEWKQVWEPSAKRWYYRHRATGIAVWDLEKELARRLRQDVPTVRDALRDGAWKMAFDEFNRRLYYYHPDTRMSCWELTPGMVDEANRRVAGKEQPAAERDPAAEAPAEPTADDAADLSLGHHASISPLRSVGPRVPPVFDESLPGSVFSSSSSSSSSLSEFKTNFFT
ncbi:hypothetical protein DIPPA_35760 [Diplonema papillatum]|nr:hypothetical protein DIPPA_35760 [Diplonema papillatum]